MTNKKGFTLIELLVSISIIAILTALLTANFIGARQRGRDGQRKANMYQIQSALELYRSDNGIYPLTVVLSACAGTLSSGGVTYMQKIPCDPSPAGVYVSNPTGAYIYTSADGSSHTIVGCLENGQDSDRDTTKNNSCSTASFTLTNP